MADEIKPPKRPRGRPKQNTTKKKPLKEEAATPEQIADIAKSPEEEYFEIIVHHQEGQSKQVGPFWGYAPNGLNRPQIWIYRGEKVIVPHWVIGCLEGMAVLSLDCDMTTIPPTYFEVMKTRAPFDILRRGLTKKDYDAFKASMEAKKHNPWKQSFTQAR